MGLTKASFSVINGAPFNVLDYGADPTGATPSTTAFQNAINAAQPSHGMIVIPTGTYLIDDTLTVYNGTQIQGETNYQYPNGAYGRDVKATKIVFTPASSKTLFNYEWAAADNPQPSGFVFYTSISGLAINATANGAYGIKLNGVIYGMFSNMSITGFATAIYCDGTIDNRFENIMCQGSYSAVVYAGNAETTDVWDTCTFNQSPVGVRFEGSAIAVRFDSCLWEQIAYYGMDVHSKCQSIMVTDAYCEDVPFGASPAADSCMFRVGLHTGSSTADIVTHLIVTSGCFNGRNAGAAGQLFNVGACWGIIVTGITANRWPVLFSTDANTQPRSITVMGTQGIQWGSIYDDVTKLSGVFANGVLNTGAFYQNARFGNVNALGFVSGDQGYKNFGSLLWVSNFGSPEGVVTAPVGSIYSRVDGGAGTALYIKETGSGNTGWVAK